VRAWASLIVGGLFGATLAAACVPDQAVLQPCTEDERCLLNYECVEGYCVECPLPDGCGGLRIGSVSFLETRICGPDQACLRVPEGTVNSSVSIGIRRSQRRPPLGDVRSLPFEYLMDGETRFRVAVTVELPISPSSRYQDIKVYRLEGDRVVELVGDATPAYARGNTLTLGTFIAIRRPPSE
jgi:hypothetical protein